MIEKIGQALQVPPVDRIAEVFGKTRELGSGASTGQS